jgi:Delta3,5-Delta2,4-dienoyl-CoA isomerase
VVVSFAQENSELSLTSCDFSEIGKCFKELAVDPDCRSIVLSGSGKHFTAGIDLMDMLEMSAKLQDAPDVSRKGKIFEDFIEVYQDSITSLEKCPKPIIACTHSAVVGAGVDMITAADIRYCSKDCWFCVKEVDIGMAADVGTLQRLPKVIGSQSLVRELCFTARKLQSAEAEKCGLVSRVFEDKNSMMEEAIKMAELIASKSPVAVQTTKRNIVYSLDHTNQEGLDHIKEINKLNLQSEDFFNAVIAGQSKGEVPVFSKL